MNVLVFGATGMIGDGVLHACLASDDVASVLAVGRSPLARSHGKLREHRRTDFLHFSDLEEDLAKVDACFFCLGVSVSGLTQARYRELTFDVTLPPPRLSHGCDRGPPSVTSLGKGPTVRSVVGSCGPG